MQKDTNLNNVSKLQNNDNYSDSHTEKRRKNKKRKIKSYKGRVMANKKEK